MALTSAPMLSPRRRTGFVLLALVPVLSGCGLSFAAPTAPVVYPKLMPMDEILAQAGEAPLAP